MECQPSGNVRRPCVCDASVLADEQRTLCVFYENVDEVLAFPPLGQSGLNAESAKAWVGKFKFDDVDKDGKLTERDRTFIGSPHPDLIAGLNATVTWKNWDFTMFWYSTIGNDLFNNTKYFTDFWMFNGNKSERMRDQSWTPGADNSNAILPILDSNDGYSGKFSNSYYVENASFLRLKNVVLGYTLPKSVLSKVGILERQGEPEPIEQDNN